MAEDCVDHAVVLARLEEKPCRTLTLAIHGSERGTASGGPLASYGSDAPAIEELMEVLPDLARPLHPALAITGAQVVWAVRQEMARTVDDVLARRTRALYLNAQAAKASAPAVARLMAAELGRDESWQRRQVIDFQEIAAHFAVQPLS
jgi:glycerol-3-phosphate dehydrogenase